MWVPAPVMAQPCLPAWLMVLLLVLRPIAVYWPAKQGDFIQFDDPDLVAKPAPYASSGQ
jgi:hypothetical protein